MKYCSYCGTQLNDNDKECMNCHHKCNPVHEEIQISEQNLKPNFSDKNEAENLYGVEQKKKKHKKLIAIISCIVGVMVLASVIGGVIYKNSNKVDTSKEGYYDFDNKFKSSTVEKFLGEWDTSDFTMSKIGVTVSVIEDFKYKETFDLFGRDIYLYSLKEEWGHVISSMMVDDDKKVAAYVLSYDNYMISDEVTNDDIDRNLIQRAAAWIYALSDNESYDDCYKTVDKLIKGNYANDHDYKTWYYADGYTMVFDNDNGYISWIFMKTDANFGERHNISDGSSIFKSKK